MPKRTTIEIDERLLAEAKRSLGQPTMRGTVEEALRRAVAAADADAASRAQRQREYLRELGRSVDVEVLTSEQMWT
jgi:Arc/MetJ family transcription regulator